MLLLSAALTVTARAQWKSDATDLNLANNDNWVNGDNTNLWFFYTGTEITYNLGEWTPAQNSSWNLPVGPDFPADLSVLSGYRVSGSGLYANTLIGYYYNAQQQVSLNKNTVNVANATGGNYTASNYGADIVVPTGYATAGSTFLYTGTYDARQLALGTLVTGAGIAEGTYIRSVDNSGQVTLSKPTDGTVSGGFTLVAPRNYSKAVTNLTYSGNVEVAGDLAYVNTYQSNAEIKNNGAGKLTFTGADTKVIVALGAIQDPQFYISGTVEFLGNVTFSNNYGINPTYNAYNGSGNAFNSGGRYIIGNSNIRTQAAISIAGDLNKNGPDTLYLTGNGAQNIIMNGGRVNLLDGITMFLGDNQALTVPKLQGASEINVASSWMKTSMFTVLKLNVNWNGGTVSEDYNFLENSAAINLYTGALELDASAGALANRKINQQAVGDVHLKSGRNEVGFTNGGTLNNFTLTMNSLQQENGATVMFVGLPTEFVGSTTTGRMLVNNDTNIGSGLVGTTSGTVSGTTNHRILPWAVGQSSLRNSSQGFAPSELVTYASGTDYGFRVLAANEYHVDFADAAADDNVRLDTAQTLANGAIVTVNALKNNVNANHSLGTGGLLNITSGVILNGANVGVNFTGSGTVSSGARPFIVSGLNTVTFDTNVVLHNAVSGTDAGLIAATSVNLKGANQIGGTVLVEGGAQLSLSHTDALSLNNAVRVDMLSNLYVAANARAAGLAGTGRVFFDSTTRKLSLGAAPDTNDLTGYVTVHSGGYIAPGDTDGPLAASSFQIGRGILGVDFKAGALFDIDIASATANGQLAVYVGDDGWKNVSNPQLIFRDDSIIRLNFIDDYAPAEGDTWLLATGFSTISADTADWSKVLLQGALGADLSEDFMLTVLDGNKLILTSMIPEPGTWALLLTGVALLAALRRRR
ncbi:MAG: PEP-CTERM sorting domain-containing protein [Verrucomicrobiales bacterium]|nr:PEP-CTERM sorting domain-containing protein [Verrucomicrobiales bacterium]